MKTPFFIILVVASLIFFIIMAAIYIKLSSKSGDSMSQGMAMGFGLMISAVSAILFFISLFFILLFASKSGITSKSAIIAAICLLVVFPPFVLFTAPSALGVIQDFLSERRTPALIKAARDGNLNKVIKIIERGDSVFISDPSGTMPLHFAAMKGHLDIVKYLVEHGAGADAPWDAYRSTPLFYAKEHNHTDIVAYLLEKGAYDDDGGRLYDSPLHIAVREGDMAEVKRQIGKGVTIDSKGNYRHTPLHMAAALNKIDIVEYLLSRGANIEARGEDQKTPLLTAIRYGKSLELVKLLIARGADINAKDYYGKDALYFAENDCAGKDCKEIADFIRRLNKESPAN